MKIERNDILNNLNLTSEQLINILKAEGFKPRKIGQIMTKVVKLEKYNEESLINGDNFTYLNDFPINKATLIAFEIKEIKTVGDLKRFVILNGSIALKEKFRAIGDSRYNELKRIFPWIKDYENETQ